VRAGPPGPDRAPAPDAVASYLGVTKAELRTARDNGTIARAARSAAGQVGRRLEQAIYNAAKSDLDKAVAAGRITAAQEKSMLSGLQSHLDDMVNSNGPPSLLGTSPPRRVARPSGRERLRSARGRSRPA
jgi:hypothetical protein